MTSNKQLFEKISKATNNVLIRNNDAYGNSFDKSIDKYGLVAFSVRESDKLNRFDTLVEKGDFKENDESIFDTLVDTANYAKLTIAKLVKDGLVPESKLDEMIGEDQQQAQPLKVNIDLTKTNK